MSKANKIGVSLIVLGAFLAGMPKAQAQGEPQVSVADAARRAREQKKETAKPATVVTNDTLEPPKSTAPTASPGATNEPNTATATSGTNSPVTSAPSQPQPAPESASTSAIEQTPRNQAIQPSDLKALKQQIAEKQLEMDLIQRALALANDSFYSRPDFSKDEDGKAKLEAMKIELAQKQEELAQLKAQLPSGADTKEEKPAESGSQPQSEAQTPPPEQQPPQE